MVFLFFFQLQSHDTKIAVSFQSLAKISPKWHRKLCVPGCWPILSLPCERKIAPARSLVARVDLRDEETRPTRTALREMLKGNNGQRKGRGIIQKFVNHVWERKRAPFLQLPSQVCLLETEIWAASRLRGMGRSVSDYVDHISLPRICSAASELIRWYIGLTIRLPRHESTSLMTNLENLSKIYFLSCYIN